MGIKKKKVQNPSINIEKLPAYARTFLIDAFRECFAEQLKRKAMARSKSVEELMKLTQAHWHASQIRYWIAEATAKEGIDDSSSPDSKEDEDALIQFAQVPADIRAKLPDTLETIQDNSDFQLTNEQFEWLTYGLSGEQNYLLSKKLDRRAFDRLLGWLYDEELLLLPQRILPGSGMKLSAALDANFTVVGSNSSQSFAAIAATEFIREIFSVAQKNGNSTNGSETPKDSEKKLNVGIVSGSTIESVIDYLVNTEDWQKEFGVDPRHLSKVVVQVIALNVCLTQGADLARNATVLAYRLARKINEQASFHNGSWTANPLGLSAPLIVTEDERKEADNQPETRDVIQVTQPSRISSEAKGVERYETQLHVVLTSVGAEQNSLYEKLKEYLFNKAGRANSTDETSVQHEPLVESVGDIVYTPVRYNGEEIEIKTSDNKLIGLYSAVELGVLERIAKDSNRRVILVARYDDSKDKTRAILATLGSARRYVDSLIIDQDLAKSIMSVKNIM